MRDSEGESDGSEDTSSDSDGGHRLPFARFSIARGEGRYAARVSCKSVRMLDSLSRRTQSPRPY